LVKIKVKNPNEGLLREAVKALAKQRGGEVVDEIQDYYGSRQKVMVGLRDPIFHRGIGLTVEKDGEVKLVGDLYQVPQDEVHRLEGQIIQAYAAKAISHALSTLGYQIHLKQTRELIYIQGVM
jgi:hypothetical protein